MQNTSTAELFMSEASIHNDVITGINYLTACYSWSHWAPRSHKMPVEWLMLLKMDAHLLHRVVCEHVLNLMFLFVGIRWRQLCWWDPEGMCLLIYVLLKTNSSTLSADCLESVKEHLALLTPVQVNWTFLPRVFSSLSGNDSDVAPSADSHPHPLQNWAIQVSIPHEGQRHPVLVIQMIMCRDELIRLN